MSARGTALSMNIVWNSAIKGSSFLQASVKGIHTYSGKLQNISLLKATKFPVINRHLDTLNKNLRKLQSTSAKISRTPLDLGITKSRDTLKEILRETKAVERATKQTAFYSQKDAENRLRAVRASKAEANALTRATTLKTKKDRNVSAGAVVGTAMALSPLVLPLRSSFNFEEAITSVNAKTDTAYAKDIPLLRSTAVRLGSSTEWTMTQVAQGEEYLTMAGFNPKQIAQAMGGNLALATVGDLDLATSSDIASNILTGFSKKAGEMDRVADVMAKTITTSNTNITELGTAMSYVAPVAQALRGQKAFIETTALTGVLAGAGIKSDKAGTVLRQMYARLSAPSKEGNKELSKLHVSAYGKDGKFKSMSQILGEINQAFQKQHYSDEQKNIAIKKIFGMVALSGASYLLKEGQKSILEYQTKIDNSSGEALRIQKMKLDTPIGQMKLFGSALEGLSITMTQQLIPPFKTFMQTMTKGVNLINSWAKENPKLATSIYGIGIALGVTTVALMAFGLVSTLVGKGIKIFGFKSKKACGSIGCIAGNAGKANNSLKGMNRTVGQSVKLFKNPLTLTITLVGVTAVLAGLKKVADMSHQAIQDKHSIAPTTQNLTALKEKAKRLEQRIKDAKGQNGWWNQGLESFVHGVNDPAKIKQLEKLLARTRRNIKIAEKKAVSVAPKPVLPKPVPTAVVESPTAVTAQHLSGQKVDVKTDNSQTHITNHFTIHAKGTDPQEILQLIKQYERMSAMHKIDTQLKDAV